MGSSSGYAGTNQIPYIQSNIYANYTTGVLNVPYGILSGASISTTNLALTGLTTGTVAYYLGVDPYGVVYKTTAVGPTITGQVGNVNYYLIGTNLTSGGLTVADIDNGNRFYFNPSSAYLYVANLGVTGSNGMTIANSSNPSLGIQIGTIGTIQTVFFTTGIATTAGYVPGTLANDSYIQASNNIVFQTPTTYGINYEIGNSQVVSINSSGLLIPTISNLTISGNLIIPSISSSTNYNTLLGLNIGSSKTVIGITAPTLSGLQVYNASAPAVNITNSATATTYITTAMVTSANAYITGTTVNDGIVYTSGNLWLGSSLSSGILTTNLPINGISIAFTNGTYQGVYWNSGSSTAAMSNVPVAGNFFTDAVVGDTILKATSGYSLRLGAGTGLSALDLTSSLVTANYPVQTNVGYGAGNGIRFPLIGYDYGYNGGNIYAGTADAYNPTGGNDLMIGSWYGLGFVSNTDNVTRGAINCRTGDLQMSGNIVSLGYFNCANTGSMQCYLNRTSASAGYGVVTVSQLNNVNHCVQGGGWRAGSAFNTYGSWFADPLNNGSFPSNSAMTNALIYADWVNGVYTNSSFTMNAGTMRILGTNPLYHESGTITNTTGANINLTPAGASLVTFNNLNYHSAPSGYFNSNYMTLWNTNSYGSGSTNNGTGIALTNSQNTGNFSLWSYGYGATSQYSSVYLISNYSGTGVTMAAGGTSWGAYSDARVKKNIKPIQDGLDNILQLKPVHYQYLKDEEDDVIKTHRHGFIAQEFDTVYPMHVNKQNAPYKDASGNDIENPWSIHTIEIIPDLVHSIQSLYKTNQQQATQIQTLTDHMTELTNQVNALTKLRSKK